MFQRYGEEHHEGATGEREQLHGEGKRHRNHARNDHQKEAEDDELQVIAALAVGDEPIENQQQVEADEGRQRFAR